LAYAYLGPLHYLTEISWLHDRNYFSKGKYDFLVLLIVGILLSYAAFAKDFGVSVEVYDYFVKMNLFDKLLVFALFSSILFALVKNLIVKIVAILFLFVFVSGWLSPENSDMNSGSTMVFALTSLVPTLIHVYLFTGLFMLFGALKSRSKSGLWQMVGFVSNVNVNIGKYVNPTDVLFELVDPTDIHLNLKVFEKDLVKLAIGQKLIAYSNSDSNKKFECEIILISQAISEDGSAEVHCHFSKYDKSLFPGMYMNAEIELKSNQVLAVEEEAIVSFEGKNYVFVKQGKKTFEMLEVEVGTKENGWVEVLNNTNFDGKEIVSKGAYTLLMTLKNKAEE
jgi:hypothetical protein